ADEKLSEAAQRWVAWRSSSLARLAQSLRQVWRTPRKEGRQVWLSGDSAYENVAGFDALRSGQDWRRWLAVDGKDRFDGALIEGRWSAGDAKYVESWMPTPTHFTRPRIVPIIQPGLDATSAGLAAEWRTISAQLPTLREAGFVVRNEAALRETLALAQGRALVPQQAQLQIGTVAPDVRLLSSQGTLWSTQSQRGKNSVVLLQLTSREAPSQEKQILQSLSALGQQISWRGAVVGVVRAESVTAKDAAKNTGTPESDTTVLRLQDTRREWLPRLPGGISVVAIDRAGFVRAVESSITPEKAAERALALADSTPPFAEGKPAPDFTVIDMNGQERKLSALRGHKSLILTFFPKCFTGGCANHLSSLSTQFEAFEAADIEVLAVSIDPADVQREFARRWALRFALVPDTGRNLCFLYGAAADSQALATRQTVFIDRDGIVRFIDRSVEVHSHGNDVLTRLREMKLVP
ncbi:MAG TPA: peroxiredoxin family protein, partial [Abditibacteriaceae bacterium]